MKLLKGFGFGLTDRLIDFDNFETYIPRNTFGIKLLLRVIGVGLTDRHID